MGVSAYVCVGINGAVFPISAPSSSAVQRLSVNIKTAITMKSCENLERLPWRLKLNVSVCGGALASSTRLWFDQNLNPTSFKLFK